MATLETIKRVLREISASYPGRFTLDDDNVKAWTIYLVDIEDELLVNAVRSFISSSAHGFPPSIPELRAEATKIRRQIAGVPDVWTAWAEVEHADEKRTSELETAYDEKGEAFQTHYARAFSHPIVRRVAVMLGWPDRFPDPDNLMPDRAAFRDAYKEALGQATKEDMQLLQVKQYTQLQSGQPKQLGDVMKGMNNG